jgi:putative flippase GtrA
VRQTCRLVEGVDDPLRVRDRYSCHVSSTFALYGKFRDLIHEAARFGVVGLAGVAVTDGGANLLQYGAGMDPFTATAIATIVATALSFVASRYWTFRHRERSGARRETVLFFTMNGIGVAITEGCVGLAPALGMTGKFSYNVALIGGIALATLFRYWSYRKWVWPAATTASGRTSRWPVRRMAHEWLSRLPVRELAKFGVVGAFAFMVTVSGLFLLHARAGAGPLTSIVVTAVVAMAVSYAGNRCWTFRHRQRIGLRRESIRYAAFHGAGLAIQLACVALAGFVLGQHGNSSLAALVIGTGAGAIVQFWSYREWVWPSLGR